MEAAAGATRQQFYPLSCSFLTAQNYIQLNFTKITSNWILKTKMEFIYPIFSYTWHKSVIRLVGGQSFELA